MLLTMFQTKYFTKSSQSLFNVGSTLSPFLNEETGTESYVASYIASKLTEPVETPSFKKMLHGRSDLRTLE